MLESKMANRPSPKTQTVISFVLNDCKAQISQVGNGLVITVEPHDTTTQPDNSTKGSSWTSNSEEQTQKDQDKIKDQDSDSETDTQQNDSEHSDIDNSDAEQSKADESEVDKSEVEQSDTGKSNAEKSDTEQSWAEQNGEKQTSEGLNKEPDSNGSVSTDKILSDPPNFDDLITNDDGPLPLFPVGLYSPRTSPSPTSLHSLPVLTPNSPTVFLQNSDFEKTVTSPSSSSATLLYLPTPPPPPPTTTSDPILSQGQFTNTARFMPSTTTINSPSTSNYNFQDFKFFPLTADWNPCWKPCPNPIVKVRPLKIQKVSDTTQKIDEAATASSTQPPEPSSSESDTTEGSIWSPYEYEESEEEYTVTKVTQRKHRTKTTGKISGNKKKFTKRK